VSDKWAVALAVAVFAGALAAVDGHVPALPLAPLLAVVGACWLLGRRARLLPALVCLGAALLAAALAQRSLAGLDAPLATGPVHAEVVLVTDPVPDGRGGVTVDVRLDGRRLWGVARLSAASALDDRLAGERVTVIGEVRPPGPVEARLRHRHLAGRLAIDTVVGWRPGDGAARLANGLRRTLARGAEALPERQRSLLAGVTLGDDRQQPADMTDAFRAAGLTHLLAVSGQNVAFVLVVVAPALTRLRFGPRLAATLAVLAGFALVTRAEPSVLRAVAMASVAAVGTAVGRPTSSLRTLALGVAAMLLVDPLLATSLGFRLSVAGAGGIVVGAARLEARLPGPRWLAASLAVTLAAQAAVSPLLVTAFDSVPLASLPANLLAAPAAGPLMVWGLTGGLVAGLAGGTLAQVIHLPTRLLLAWLEGVATTAAGWPLGELRGPHLVALGAAALALAAGGALTRPGAHGGLRSGVGAATAARTSLAARPAAGGRAAVGAGSGGAGSGARSAAGAGARRRVAAGRVLSGVGAVVSSVVVVATIVPLWRPAEPVELEQPLGVGASLWRGGGAVVVVVDGRARDDLVLGGLRRAAVGRVDLVVVRTAATAAAEVVATLRRRWPDVPVLAPRPDDAAVGDTRASVEGAVSPPVGASADVGGLRLTVAASTPGRLDVDIGLAVTSAPARPP
jgi:competence protein ComEC